MTAHTLAQVGLLDLPTEARLRVYHHCFTTKSHPTDTDWVKIDIQSGRILVKPHVWPLFQVCKQIYTEVMPEYYSSTIFHFNSLAHLRQTISSHAIFKTHVRYVVLNPHFLLPDAEELLVLPNLHSFAVNNILCHEPIHTSEGEALDYETLKSAINVEESIAPGLQPVKAALKLRDGMAKTSELRERDVRLLLRLRYTYVEKALHPDGWGGKTAKRHRLIDYDCMDNTFTLLEPDAGEKCLITPSDA